MAKLKTGRHTSAIKAFRQAQKRTAHNRAIKKSIRLLAKQVEAAISGKKKAEASKLLVQCFSAWDKAAKVGVVHANAASRKKARLSAKLAKLTSAA
jgi:small subunit ribosomal protein S20